MAAPRTLAMPLHLSGYEQCLDVRQERLPLSNAQAKACQRDRLLPVDVSYFMFGDDPCCRFDDELQCPFHDPRLRRWLESPAADPALRHPTTLHALPPDPPPYGAGDSGHLRRLAGRGARRGNLTQACDFGAPEHLVDHKPGFDLPPAKQGLRMTKIIGAGLKMPKTFRKNRLPSVSAGHPKEKSNLCQPVDLT